MISRRVAMATLVLLAIVIVIVLAVWVWQASQIPTNVPYPLGSELP